MSEAEEPEQERGPQPREPADRLSRMSRAAVRITGTLDLDAALQGVVAGFRSLTGARYGCITVLELPTDSPPQST